MGVKEEVVAVEEVEDGEVVVVGVVVGVKEEVEIVAEGEDGVEALEGAEVVGNQMSHLHHRRLQFLSYN